MSLHTASADPQLIRSNKLELIERVADDMAHEIKNPLHSMVINLEVLKRRIARSEGSPREELLRYAEVLATELERVNRRVDLLLRMVRPERGGDPTTLGETVDELIQLLELERARRGVTIHFEPTHVPTRAHLPRESGRQLVLNLLLEGLDAVEDGESLSVVAGVEPGVTFLRIESSQAEAFSADSARITAARGLTEQLGGRLEIDAPGAGSSAGAGPHSLLLSLPLPGAPTG